jgi:hypothetical protein
MTALAGTLQTQTSRLSTAPRARRAPSSRRWPTSDAIRTSKGASLTAEDEPDPGLDPPLSTGLVPSSYFNRLLARAVPDRELRFVDVDHPRTHAELTRSLPTLLRDHDLREFDRGVVMAQDRRITRAIAGTCTRKWAREWEVCATRAACTAASSAGRCGSTSMGCCPDARSIRSLRRCPNSSKQRNCSASPFQTPSPSYAASASASSAIASCAKARSTRSWSSSCATWT